MTFTRKIKRRRYAMWKADPRCYWCGVGTILPSWFKTMRPDLKQKLKDRMATIDHLRPRHHPLRREPANGEIRWVLSCNKCNNERDQYELSVKPKEYFYQNGGSKPLSMLSLEKLHEKESLLLGKTPKRSSDRRRIAESLQAIRNTIREVERKG